MRLKINDMTMVDWYDDADFAVHEDTQNHTGGVLNMVKGLIKSISTKQRINKNVQLNHNW